MKFIHVTDTHLVPPGDMLCALEPSQRLTKVIECVNQMDGDADFMVLTQRLALSMTRS